MQGIVLIKPDAPFGLPINADQWLYYLTLAIGIALDLAAPSTWSTAAPAAP